MLGRCLMSMCDSCVNVSMRFSRWALFGPPGPALKANGEG